MNRSEALRILGLEEDVSENEIKIAYRELAQILHPDKYATNRKLAARAEEQLKRVNEAYDYLRKHPAQAGAGSTGKARGAAPDSGSDLRARLAGIAAARAQLTVQLDHELDSRRVGIGLLVGGLVAFLIGERTGFRLLDGLGGAALIWGAIQFFSSQANIRAVRAHLKQLDQERQKYEQDLEDL